jgi:hypothetical protein
MQTQNENLGKGRYNLSTRPLSLRYTTQLCGELAEETAERGEV